MAPEGHLPPRIEFEAGGGGWAAGWAKDASDFNEKKFDHHQASSRQLDSFSLGMLSGKVLLEIDLCFASFTKTSHERL